MRERFCLFLILFEVRSQVVSRGKKQERENIRGMRQTMCASLLMACSMPDSMPENWVPGSYTLGAASS